MAYLRGCAPKPFSLLFLLMLPTSSLRRALRVRAPPHALREQVILYDALDLKVMNKVVACRSRVVAVSFSRDGKLLATASEQGTVIRIFTVPSAVKVGGWGEAGGHSSGGPTGPPADPACRMCYCRISGCLFSGLMPKRVVPNFSLDFVSQGSFTPEKRHRILRRPPLSRGTVVRAEGRPVSVLSSMGSACVLCAFLV